MVSGESVRANDFAINLDIATAIAEQTTSQAPKFTSANPGRRMTNMPARPRTTASQRILSDGSPTNTMAPIEAYTGTIKESAVASASGTMVMA